MKFHQKELLEKLKNNWKAQLTVIAMALLFLAVLIESPSRSSEAPSVTSTKIQLDHMTPAGFVLVTLDIQNLDALLNVLGPTGMIHLYHSKSKQVIAKGIKVLRAPQAPETLVALVPEQLSSHIVQSAGELYAVLQNPNEKVGTNFVKKQRVFKRQIFIGQGERSRQNFAFLLVFFSNLSVCYAASPVVAIRAEQADALSFNAFISAYGGITPYSQYSQSLQPNQKQKSQLFDLFQQAQTSYFSQTKDLALEKYLKVLDLAHKTDWNLQQRKLFFTSALRAAELSKDSSDIQIYLKYANSFSYQQKIKSDVFSPPLISAFKDNQKHFPPQKVNLNPHLKKYDFISVAGQRHSIKTNSTITIPPGSHLVTLYSSTYLPAQKLLKTESIEDWKPQIEPLAKGSCQKPQIHPKPQQLNGHVYFNEDCILPLGNTPTLNLAATPSLRNKPQKINPLLSAQQTSINLKKPKPWWKNKWVWIGVAGAGAAYMIYENNSRSSNGNSQPTTTYE